MEDKEFESDIKMAFKRMKRIELKQQLMDFENQTNPYLNIESTTNLKTRVTKNYWKYAIAACVLITLGLFVFYLDNKKSPQVASTVPPKLEPIIPTPAPSVNPNKNKEIEKELSKIQTFKIITDNLGFGSSEKIIVKTVQKQSMKDIQYIYENEKLTLQSDKPIKVQNVVSYSDNKYIKINDQFYLLNPHKTFTNLLPIKDQALGNELIKIEFSK